jgi:uncharacterized protein YcfJ
MNRTLVTGLAISAAFMTAGAAVAGLGIADRGRRYAQVLAVAPVVTTTRVPREVCADAAPRRASRAADRCRTVVDERHAVVGYDVRYRLAGEVATVRLDRPPGDRLVFENGLPRPATGG